MSPPRSCASCGAILLPDSPQGVCPRCALQLGMALAAPGGTDPTLSKPAGQASSPFVPPKPEQLAPHFPQLEILDLIGQGGMGAVYKARQRGLDRIVALKILPPDAGADPSFAERFQREAKALARLNHPHIVSIYDSGQAGGLFYFLMEFVDGVNLRQAIQARTLSPRESLAIVPQICDALQYAHDEGVVHRDIKPENILLDAKGRIKIADFGLARLLGQAGDSYTLTGTHQVMGTPRYMAPEQLEGTHAVDHRADIYSLGVVLYEMLTHELPLGRFAPPSRKVQLDVRLDEVVLRTLEKEPALRFQQASELKTAVETICGLADLPLSMRRMYGYEYRSRTELFGVPLVHIAYGLDPRTHRRRVAKGIIAVGDMAIGGFAVGGMALGLLAVGGCSVGLVTLGGFSMGLLVALGGGAIGLGFSAGGMAIGSVAVGGCAVGIYALGGGAYGPHALGGNVRDPAAREFFRQEWRSIVAVLVLVIPLVFMAATICAGIAMWLLQLTSGSTSRTSLPRQFPEHIPREPTRHGAGFAAGCAAILMLLLFSGVVLGFVGLVGYRMLLTRSAVQQAMAAEQLERARANAARADAMVREAAKTKPPASGLLWDEGKPALAQALIQQLGILPATARELNQRLEASHARYLELEATHCQQATTAHSCTTTIQVPQTKIDELEHALWLQLDAQMPLEQQQTLRDRLWLWPPRSASVKGVDTPHLVMPGLLGWGADRVTVEIQRRGQWFFWNVNRIFPKDSGRLDVKGSGMTLPWELRRFWTERAEDPAADRVEPETVPSIPGSRRP